MPRSPGSWEFSTFHGRFLGNFFAALASLGISSDEVAGMSPSQLWRAMDTARRGYLLEEDFTHQPGVARTLSQQPSPSPQVRQKRERRRHEVRSGEEWDAATGARGLSSFVPVRPLGAR